jgi:hypothetical protein
MKYLGFIAFVLFSMTFAGAAKEEPSKVYVVPLSPPMIKPSTIKPEAKPINKEPSIIV